MLERKDRTSMMNGFEVRVPFCDYQLVEYLWNVPFEMKSIDNIEKGILRRAFENVLPEDVRYRKKVHIQALRMPLIYKVLVIGCYMC